VDIESVEIDREETPLGRLSLRRYRTSEGENGYEILLDGHFMMASHGSHSERLMAPLAAARLKTPGTAGLRVLVGGLGAGHTLRAALDLPNVERVTVAEIGKTVVEWNRRYFGTSNGRAVDDPRVVIQVTDVLECLSTPGQNFDMVLLDVDNGPGWLATPGNRRLYDRHGLEACREALRPGGVLAVWSPQRNPFLECDLGAVLGEWERVDTTAWARAEGEPPCIIYLARRAEELS
jgi:spermidine synthase